MKPQHQAQESTPPAGRNAHRLAPFGFDITTLVVLSFISALGLYSLVYLFRSWVLMLGLLGLAILWQHSFGWHRRLDSQALRLHLLATAGFALVSTIWKAWLRSQGEDDSSGIENRIQHLVWAAATVAILLPLFSRLWAGRKTWERILVAVAVVALIGNAVEVLEYQMHVDQYRVEPAEGSRDYSDTMRDLIMNVIGSALGALFLFRFRLRSRSNEAAGLRWPAQDSSHRSTAREKL